MKVLAIGIERFPLESSKWQVVSCEDCGSARVLLDELEDIKAVVTSLEIGWPRGRNLPVFLVGASPEQASSAGAQGALKEPLEASELLGKLEKSVHHPSLGALLHGLEDAFCLLDRERRYVYVNQTAADLSGELGEDLVGKEIFEVFPSLRGTEFELKLELGLLHGTASRFRRRSPLNQRVFEHRFYPTDHGVALVSSDVTDLVNQENEARQTERRLAAVFEQSEQFMAILDIEHNLLELNRWAQIQMGVEPATARGQPLWATPWWEPYEEPLRRRLIRASEGVAGLIEISYRCALGDPRVLECTITPVSEQDSGQVELIVVQGVDQTERRRGELHLRCLAQAGETLASSLDYRETLGKVARLAVPEVADWASVYLLEEGRTRLLALAHMDPKQMEMARAYNERYPPDPEGRSGASKVALTGESELVEEITDAMLVSSALDEEHLAATRALGLRSYLCVPLVARNRILGALALLTADSGRALGPAELRLAQQLAARAALAVDNSRLFEASLQASLKLEQAHHAALRANRMKSAFLANMSHEIRTPMNGIRGMLEFLEEMPLSPEGGEYLATIRQCSDSLLHILNDILDLSRIEAGKLEILNTRFELRRTLMSVSSLFRHSALEKGLEYELSVESKVPEIALGDSDRLRQIFGNLLSNAVKFTEHGYVRSRAAYERGYLRLDVLDSGPGIPADLHESLFEAFGQGDETTTRRFGGTGLGLSIVRSLCELMGGEVHYSPSPEGGSQFTVSIPLMPSTLPSEPKRPEAKELTIPPGLHVLLVEDNPVNRRVLKLQLTRLQCRVESACDGVEALSKVAEALPRLILMDCQMPNLDGYETTRRIRKMPLEPQPCIIALTAHAMKGERERCLQAGMNDFLPKPISLSELTQVLARSLESY